MPIENENNQSAGMDGSQSQDIGRDESLRGASASLDDMSGRMSSFTGGGGSMAEIGRNKATDDIDSQNGADEIDGMEDSAEGGQGRVPSLTSGEEENTSSGGVDPMGTDTDATTAVEGADAQGGFMQSPKDKIAAAKTGGDAMQGVVVAGGAAEVAEATEEAAVAAVNGVGQVASALNPGTIISSIGSTVGNALSSVGGAIAGAFHGAVGVVAGGISTVTGMAAGAATTVASVVLPTALVAVIGTGVVGGVTTMQAQTALNVGAPIDCVEEQGQKLALTGRGDNSIPDGLGDVYSYSAIWTDGWYLSDGTSPTGVAASALKNIWEQWVAKGAECDEYGTLTYDGKLLVATTTTYGSVGDNVVFYLDDGTGLDCILFDVKRSTDSGCNEWGHVDGHCVLEFEQKPKALGGPGTNPGAANNHPELAGRRVATWTNKGHYSGISLGGGVLDDSAAGANAANALSNKAAKSNCRKLLANVDNSSAATAAASFAWPEHDHSDDGTELWRTVRQEVWAGRDQNQGASYYYKSCDVTVATALQWSGTDMSYPMYATSEQLKYVTGEGAYANAGGSGKWQEVTAYATEGTAALQPGDVLLRDGHTGIYVGNEILQSIHGDALGDAMDVVSGSLSERPPTCGWAVFEFPQSQYKAYRCVQPDGDTTYSLVGK